MGASVDRNRKSSIGNPSARVNRAAKLDLENRAFQRHDELNSRNQLALEMIVVRYK